MSEIEIPTKNIKLVAFLRLKQIFPIRVEKIAKGKAKYFFDLEPTKWEELKSEFDRSPFLTYAQCLDAVVDLAY